MNADSWPQFPRQAHSPAFHAIGREALIGIPTLLGDGDQFDDCD